MNVSQQAVAKWERAGAPRDRVREIAKQLRVSPDVLLVDEDPSKREDRVAKEVNEIFFADQVVVCFPGRNFHYCPAQAEASQFFEDIQGGPFVHLSAGPVQVVVNADAALRVDMSEDPPLSSFKPYPISPLDREDDTPASVETSEAESNSKTDGEPKPDEETENGQDGDAEPYWFEQGYCRVYLRGAPEPYTGLAQFFEDALDNPELSKKELIEMAESFEHQRPSEDDIYDLFDYLASCGEAIDTDERLIFYSEDYDGVRQVTFVRASDIEVIEVPTRVWELHRLAQHARNQALEAEERGKNVAEKTKAKSRGFKKNGKSSRHH
jgi:hypothetical protein